MYPSHGSAADKSELGGAYLVIIGQVQVASRQHVLSVCVEERNRFCSQLSKKIIPGVFWGQPLRTIRALCEDKPNLYSDKKDKLLVHFYLKHLRQQLCGS